jgi:hypothetical protein
MFRYIGAFLVGGAFFGSNWGIFLLFFAVMLRDWSLRIEG